jgi:hypothetical protein
VSLAIIQLRKEPAYRREAFEKGLKRLGYIVDSEMRNRRPSSRDDLLVMWNKKAGQSEEQADDWERRGGTVIVTENAYLQRIDKSMYAISTHGHNGSGWFPVGDEDRFSRLGFEIKPRQSNAEGHILVCGQRMVGSKLMASPPQWGEKTVAKLKARGEKNVRFRPHPGNFVPKVPLFRDLKGCKECVIWSSAAGVQALVEGVPVRHAAPYWVCSDSSRELALHRMSHGQWKVAEVENGEPFARMRALDWGPAKWA